MTTETTTLKVLTGRAPSTTVPIDQQVNLEYEKPPIQEIQDHINDEISRRGTGDDTLIFASQSFMDRFSTVLARMRAQVGGSVTDAILVNYVRRAISVLNQITPVRDGWESEFSTQEVLDKAIELFNYERTKTMTKSACR